ncbi:hypothetical protein [Brevundimonas sp. Root1423]|uniref:hypothetical protein n=1 Tax=Brevundimonas sp. Root1423 TaxID=1736462 RepID=UPI00138F0894|nr:hypothetical protein [Brevundimonas sp. Root1423]
MAHDPVSGATVTRLRQRRHCRNGLRPGDFDLIFAASSEFTGGPTNMISALEIGIALSAPLLLVLAYALAPKPKPVRIRTRDARSRRGPHA